MDFSSIDPITRRNKWWLVHTTILTTLVLLNVVSRMADAQSGHPHGLQRSYSDPRFNRNSSFRKQTSYRGHCNTNYRFDYIQLTLLWPAGACSTSPQECKRSASKHFTVHGMWPTIKGTQEPSNCCFDNTFDYQALEPILTTLNEYWYSYYDDSNREFWAHEWLKHGTCSRDIASLKGEARYFGTTVNLAIQLGVLETLAKANVVPQNDKIYQSSDIINALKPVTKGKYFQIDCDYEHNHPIPIMRGLNFCFDANLTSTDCPEMKRKCQRKVIFPATPTTIH